ncbi:cytochrome P450 716B1-like [Phoenix dactylifera]|uniref:Cytochrome P450 716B1-like n=1 Tax=Phoenix dactylifera TaxID=42345 RepID=A0A8B9AN30_PHODC|nr:cytochrome P450 716B1-like [Phoenix dactylifera]
MPLMKCLTFDIICSLMFGLKRGPMREGLAKDFADMLAGMWAVPLNLPFTHFSRSLRASQRARKVLAGITRERRSMAAQGQDSSGEEDLITRLLTLGGEDGPDGLTDEEIVDNAMLVMVAGHDTSSILMTFMIRHLAKDQVTCDAVVHGNKSFCLLSMISYELFK